MQWVELELRRANKNEFHPELNSSLTRVHELDEFPMSWAENIDSN